MRTVTNQPGDTIAIPVGISDDILDVYGFELDLQVTPSAGAPALKIDSMAKGAAVSTTPEVESNLLPSERIRIGLPTEIPPAGEARSSFDGPGSIVDIQFNVQASAVAGYN